MSRLNVLAVLPGFVPSTMMDVVKPMLNLQRQNKVEFKVTIEGLFRPLDLKGVHLVIFCRNVEPAYTVIDHVLEKNLPFIYDIDDNFSDIPADTSLGQYHRDPGRINQYFFYMRSAGLVRVYSPLMLQKVKELNPRVELVTPPLDWSLVQFSSRPRDANKIKIVYSTSRVDDQVARIFLPGLEEILRKYSGKVEMYFWGWIPDVLKGLPNVHYLPPVFNYDLFMRRFSQSQFDIGLAPMSNDPFHLSKTNNKFREYSACRIAGIYSDVSVYTDCIEDGVTGLIVPDQPGAWFQALQRLIENEELRASIVDQAEAYSRTHYSQENFDQTWYEQIQTVVNQHGFENPNFSKNRPGQGRMGEVAGSQILERSNGSSTFLPLVKRMMRRILIAMQQSKADDRWKEAERFLKTLIMLYRINHLKKL